MEAPQPASEVGGCAQGDAFVRRVPRVRPVAVAVAAEEQHTARRPHHTSRAATRADAK